MAQDLVLVRPGHSVAPAESDPPLSPLGRVQAEKLAARLAGRQFSAIYTSPHRRARETAAIIGARLGLRPLVHQGLRDVPAGPGALLAFARLARFVNEIRGDRRAVVVTHHGALRFLLLWAGDWPRLLWLWRPLPSCQPFACERQARGLGVPLLLLLAGFAIGLAALPGPRPGLATLGSGVLALACYALTWHLARRGRYGQAVVLLAAAAMALFLLAFGPNQNWNRKVTDFNAWAFSLAARLPPAMSPAPSPNGVSGVLAAALGLAGGVALHGRGRRRVLGAAGALLAAGALALTASRAGWLAGGAALAILAAVRGRRQAILALALTGLIMVALVAGGGPRLDSPALASITSIRGRVEIWGQTASLLRGHPLLGLGLGRFPSEYATLVAPTGQPAYDSPHSDLFQLWADAGVLGLAALAWVLARVVGMAADLAGREREEGAWAWAGVAAALAAVVVHGLFETNITFVWPVGGRYLYLISPLPFALLGLLAGLYEGPRARPNLPLQASSRSPARLARRQGVPEGVSWPARPVFRHPGRPRRPLGIRERLPSAAERGRHEPRQPELHRHPPGGP